MEGREGKYKLWAAALAPIYKWHPGQAPYVAAHKTCLRGGTKGTLCSVLVTAKKERGKWEGSRSSIQNGWQGGRPGQTRP